MTAETRALLQRMVDQGSVYIAPGSGDISRARSLKLRGYATGSAMNGGWRPTDAGRAAL